MQAAGIVALCSFMLTIAIVRAAEHLRSIDGVLAIFASCIESLLLATAAFLADDSIVFGLALVALVGYRVYLLTQPDTAELANHAVKAGCTAVGLLFITCVYYGYQSVALLVILLLACITSIAETCLIVQVIEERAHVRSVDGIVDTTAAVAATRASERARSRHQTSRNAGSAASSVAMPPPAQWSTRDII